MSKKPIHKALMGTAFGWLLVCSALAAFWLLPQARTDERLNAADFCDADREALGRLVVEHVKKGGSNDELLKFIDEMIAEARAREQKWRAFVEEKRAEWQALVEKMRLEVREREQAWRRFVEQKREEWLKLAEQHREEMRRPRQAWQERAEEFRARWRAYFDERMAELRERHRERHEVREQKNFRKESREALELRRDALQGRRDEASLQRGMGQFVTEALEKGLRGRELAASIREELRRRGIGPDQPAGGGREVGGPRGGRGAHPGPRGR